MNYIGHWQGELMDQDYILKKLQNLLDEKGWSYYRLAKESGVSLSCVRNNFRNGYLPSFSNLLKFCNALGISMGQFFTEEEISWKNLSSEQKEVLETYESLTPHQKELACAYMKGLSDTNKTV